MNFPATSLLRSIFTQAYRLIAVVGEDVTLRYRKAGGGGFDDVTVRAKVSALNIADIVAGSSARLGDLRAIVWAESIPAGQRRMDLHDRVAWRGREYAVVQYDDATASLDAAIFGVSIVIRG